MNGWTIALVVGAVVMVMLVGLCSLVLKALRTTAEGARAVLDALEQVQASTASLTRLDSATQSLRGATEQLSASRPEPEPEPEGRSSRRPDRT